MIDPTQFEINLPNRNPNAAVELSNVANFMAKYRCPAIVAAPDYIEAVMIERLRTAGRWKIIAAIDFENRDFAMNKFTRQLPRAVLEADGFDVLLSANRNNADSFNELSSLTNFIRQLSQVYEIRWTLGTRLHPPEQLKMILSNLQRHPCQYMRSDIGVLGEAVSEELHRKDIDLIRAHTAAPIKLSGVGDLQTMDNLRTKVARFDVTLTVAQRLMRQVDDLKRRERNNDLARTNNNGVRTEDSKPIRREERKPRVI